MVDSIKGALAAAGNATRNGTAANSFQPSFGRIAGFKKSIGLRMNTARGHHFVSQCYLDNFTTDGQVTAVDFENGRCFTTSPKNVAKQRDFNRIESAELKPDALENAYGAFEGELAPILKKLANGGGCSEDEFAYVLNLIALLAVRNPRSRERFAEFQDDVGQKMLRLMTATKDRWESQVSKDKAAGYMDGVKDVPYEAIKAGVLNRRYRVVTTTNHHARLELGAFDGLLQVLARRSWRWLRARPNTGGFITCDHPVCIYWNERPEGFAPLGYGLTGTAVIFPVAPFIALEGQFDGSTTDRDLDVFEVGLFNARMINNAHRQIYAINNKFLIFDTERFHDVNDVVQRAREKPPRKDRRKPDRLAQSGKPPYVVCDHMPPTLRKKGPSQPARSLPTDMVPDQ
jgi:Protein of unknown function (DUF4238)